MGMGRSWGAFPSRPLLLGIRASSWNADLYVKDAVTARSPKYAFLAANNVRYAPRYRSLICYQYRCELGWLRLIFSANLGTGNFTHALSERPPWENRSLFSPDKLTMESKPWMSAPTRRSSGSGAIPSTCTAPGVSWEFRGFRGQTGFAH
jgi:hypothetical protein